MNIRILVALDLTKIPGHNICALLVLDLWVQYSHKPGSPSGSYHHVIHLNFIPAFFLANEYLRAMGIPGLADEGKVGGVYESVADIAKRYIDVAAGKSDAADLATPTSSFGTR